MIFSIHLCRQRWLGKKFYIEFILVELNEEIHPVNTLTDSVCLKYNAMTNSRYMIILF